MSGKSRLARRADLPLRSPHARQRHPSRSASPVTLYRLVHAFAVLSLAAAALGVLAQVAGAAADGGAGAAVLGWLAVLGLGVLLVSRAGTLRREGRIGGATALLALVAVPGTFFVTAFVAIGLLFTAGR